jgi:hypothetical protein
MPKIISLLFLLINLNFFTIYSQDIKLGDVTKSELEEKFYPLDSTAPAAFLYKKTRIFYEFNDQTGWSLNAKVHERIKIYNKEGYEWATKMINLYDGNLSDEKVSIKAFTYNLVDGKIEKIKLKNNEIFTEELNEGWRRKKFTMPNLQEGSIIEWEYSKHSPYLANIDDMVLQHEIPLKTVDAQFEIPEFFIFKNQGQGYYPVRIEKSTKNSKIAINSKIRNGGKKFGITTKSTTFHQSKIDFQTNITSCLANNVPALKEEPHVNNIKNYLTLFKFELSAIKFDNTPIQYFNTTWEDVTKTIYEASIFGGQLDRSNYYKEDLENLIMMTDPLEAKINKIFHFVKNKIKWNGIRSQYTFEGVRKAYNEGVGNVAEINLTLVNMLREAGLNANPVLVSTRDNGIPLAPTSKGFNYVIAAVEFQDDVILLDATELYGLPNVLPLRALNWQGRIVREDGSSAPINLFPKSYSSKMVFLNVDIDQNALISGYLRILYENLNALNYRNLFNNLSDEELIGVLEKENQNIEIIDLKVNNKEKVDKPLTQLLKFESDNHIEVLGDKTYFSPLLFLARSENPFKLESREFPVDFGAPWRQKYTINIKIPEGFNVESIPDNIAYTLPDNLGSYKFVCINKGKSISVLSDMTLNVPIVGSNYYGALKDFYKNVVDKQLEKIVLSKI